MAEMKCRKENQAKKIIGGGGISQHAAAQWRCNQKESVVASSQL